MSELLLDDDIKSVVLSGFSNLAQVVTSDVLSNFGHVEITKLPKAVMGTRRMNE